MDKDKKEASVKNWSPETTEFIQHEIPSFYINNANISFSNWDSSLTLGEIQDEKDGKLVIVPRVKVTMSLQFAIALRDLFINNIKIFEEQFGKIQTFGVLDKSTTSEIKISDR